MDLPPTSKLRFLSLEGESLTAPAEWQTALIEVLLPIEQRHQVRLFRQGRECPIYLKRLRGQERILADWERSNPGHYHLQLEPGDEIEEKFVTVLSRKIAPAAFAQLLTDLTAELPVAVAIALQQLGAFANVKFLPPQETTLAEEFNRLKRAITGTSDRPGLNKILPELAIDPHQILKTEEMWVPQMGARKPSISGLTQALQGHNLDQQRKPLRVLDRRVRHTVDVYENQLVKLFVSQVEQRLRRLQITLSSVVESTPDSHRDRNLQQQTQDLANQLKQATRQARFLAEVSLPKCPPTKLTMVLLKRPPYHAALEGYLELRRLTVVKLEEPALDAPLENLPYLYQLWGTLQVIQVLLQVANEKGYHVQQENLTHRKEQEFYLHVLRDGQPAIVLKHPQSKTQVLLISERTYDRSGSAYSTSFQQRPDIAIEIHRPEQISPDIYLFDPKYKVNLGNGTVGTPEKEDIDKMHAYRDAIRGMAEKQLVRCAAILYPGENASYGQGLKALKADPACATHLRESLHQILNQALD